jgi:hypothetical protein
MQPFGATNQLVKVGLGLRDDDSGIVRTNNLLEAMPKCSNRLPEGVIEGLLFR